MAEIVSKLDVGKQITGRLIVEVTIARSFKVRMWLATQMLKIVALVCPLSVELKDNGRAA